MKFVISLVCALALVPSAYATDHGPAFGYATPVNSQGECSFDTGVLGRHGPLGTQLTASSLVGCGITPHVTVSATLPVTFGGGSLPETRLAGGGEWSSLVAWRFLHSVTSVGRRVESTASLGLVVPGPQQDSGVLANLQRALGIAGTIATSGVLISLSFIVTYWIAPRLQAGVLCDADDPTACGQASTMSRRLLWFSAVVWSVGFFVAYLLGPIFERMDR